MICFVDIETEYAIDLKKHGAVRCASHESARISCIGYAFEDGPVNYFDYYHIWDFAKIISTTPGLTFIAHNAPFEREHLARILGINILPECWHDTMAQCAYYGYPHGLDAAAKALGCKNQKDAGGYAVMKKLVTGLYTPETAPELYAKLYSYCAKDVEVTREIYKKLQPLPDIVKQWWQLDMEINARGCPIDTIAVLNANDATGYFKEDANEQMAKITDGQLRTVNQTGLLNHWLLNIHGVDLPDCKADTVDRALNTMELPGPARAALALRQDAGLASLAKYEAMESMHVNGRLYQMFKFYGAHTGRSSGYGPQLQNLPRSENLIETARLINSFPEILTCLSADFLKDGVRGMIMAPPGKVLLGIDLAQIEARATGWCAGDQDFLDLFKTSDPYCTYGRKIFNHEITKKDMLKRTASKATVLAFGFAGGIGAGQRVAENYKMDFAGMAAVVLPTATEDELMAAQRSYGYYMAKAPIKPLVELEAYAVDILKIRYRRDFQAIVRFWDHLEQAFLLGGKAGPITVTVKNSGLRIITLPSGRELFYHNVQVKDEFVEQEDGSKKSERVMSYRGPEGRLKIWKGTLMENVAQAINADISEFYKELANRLIAPVVHHCHDEFTMEVEEAEVDQIIPALEAVLHTYKAPGYETLPLGFDTWESVRYGK